ncbi:hypothetical protein E2C01_092806 [Portunus trituberculatus]|uniref:Uncharacterized protein n=1 Tax=Portunus trituberculatus TaxID=210409 RepID=A0A5B7JWW3_PORTR|nr:hypothetical protein [Portunus trituberculatus]
MSLAGEMDEAGSREAGTCVAAVCVELTIRIISSSFVTSSRRSRHPPHGPPQQSWRSGNTPLSTSP